MASRAVNGMPPIIVKSSVARTREYFTPAEIERLMATARKASRYGHRDATMILIAYRHGLRASELCDLQWHQVELTAGRLHVRRTKRGTPSVHPMQGDEMRALRRLQREQPSGPHVFATERGGPMAPKSFHTLVVRLGDRAKMAFPIHPHMLRHACGYALANARPRYASAAGVAWTPQYPAHGSLYGNVAEQISRFLAGLKTAPAATPKLPVWIRGPVSMAKRTQIEMERIAGFDPSRPRGGNLLRCPSHLPLC
jgi:hypothetical protein